MLSNLYKDAAEHFELKRKVEAKRSDTLASICSLKELSIAIGKIATQKEKIDLLHSDSLIQSNLIKYLLDQLDGKNIDPANQSAFILVEKFLINLTNSLQAKTVIEPVIHAFALAWLQATINSPASSLSKSSPFFKILHTLIPMAYKIDPFSGEIATKQCKILVKYFLRFACSENASEETLYTHILKLSKESESKRRQLLVGNIKEHKKLEAKKKAKSIVASEIRRCIGDGLYPTILLEFVENYYTPYMEDYFVKHGAKGDGWTETSRNISFLIWAFRAEVDSNFHRYFPEKIPQALDSIVEKVDPLITDKQKLYQDFLAMEEILESRKKEGQIKLDCVFNVTEISSDGLFTNLAEKWRQQNRSETDWYLVQHKSKEAYCKLIRNDIFKEKLVFANYSGNLQIIYDTTEPSFQLEQIRASASRDKTDWDFILTDIEYEITNMHADYCDQNQEIIKEIDADIAKHLKEQQEKEKRLHEKNEEARLKREKERLLELEKAKKAKADLIAQQKKNKQKRQEYESQIDKVNLGTMITATLDDGSQAVMELNVITSTTNRYIFNDKSCQHKLAITKDKMLDMLVTGKLSIDMLGRSTGSNDVLASVIAKRREHLDSR